MLRATGAGAAYFAVVFLFAFVLGVVRTLLVAPRLGELTAVLLETPLVLAVSWLVCRRVVRWVSVAPRIPDRALMGAVAFALLMSVEFALSVLVFRRQPATWAASLLTAPGAIGLAAQAGFALVPIAQRFARSA